MKQSKPKQKPLPLVMTIGHSTRSFDEFVHLLEAHGATCVVDVRTVPRSRHNPQFNQDVLPEALDKAGLGYVHLPGLGGLRHAQRDSPNVGWRNVSFRGYADYMQTPEFAQSLEELIRLANESTVVLMCAEAVPWRCHRSLIADALSVRGIRVEDIMSPTRRQVHTLTPFAKVRGTTITYPDANPSGVRQPVRIGATALLLLCCSGPAWAGPPFATDDPDPVAYRHWEFYVASQNTKSADGWSGTAPHFEVNYGAVTNLQVHLIISLPFS